MKRFDTLLILIAITAVNFAACLRLFPAQTRFNLPPLSCISYDPRYRFHSLSPAELRTKSRILEDWIETDLKKLSAVTKCVRTYYATMGMEAVPKIARTYGLDVVLGADVTDNSAENAREVDSAVALANSYPNVRSIIIGNETIAQYWRHLAAYVDPAELIHLIDSARSRVNIPVSHAEPAYYYTRRDPNDGIPEHVDFIAANELPYWANRTAERAIKRYDWIVRDLTQRFGKKIFIAEAGAPTAGPQNLDAQPSREGAEKFLKVFLQWAESQHIDYNYLEAFDQPWKVRTIEGRLGTQWGIFDANGNFKFGTRPALNAWVLLSAGCGSLLCLALLPAAMRLTPRSTLYLFAGAQCFVVVLTLVAEVSVNQYLHYLYEFWIFVAIPSLALFVVALQNLWEAAEVFSGDIATSPPLPANRPPPFVSIHVPCCREPPEMVEQTLISLLALEYPAYEIIVIDNNTVEPELYEPLAGFCAQHPERIRFFHESVMPGYKAGALNYALRLTAPQADIIAVVDADYAVHPEWLRDLTPLFEDPKVAVVQAPQAYRDWQSDLFSMMVRDEYEGFFRIGMVQRDKRNAIIQHGTMLLLRRSAVQQVGGWGEWCITEDTELGLRILEAGYRARYIPKIYGAGLVPHSAEAYLKQRFRWVSGAMGIIRRHWKLLFGLRPGLTFSQRQCFIAGWLPWIIEASAPLFVVVGLVGTSLFLRTPLFFPPKEWAYPFALYFSLRLVNATATYWVRVKIGVWRALLSNVAGMALTWVIAAATVRGFFGRQPDFYRTQKSGRSEKKYTDRWIWRFFAFNGDIIAGGALVILAACLQMKYTWANLDAWVWSAVLTLLALPAMSRAFLSLCSRRYAKKMRA